MPGGAGGSFRERGFQKLARGRGGGVRRDRLGKSAGGDGGEK